MEEVSHAVARPQPRESNVVWSEDAQCAYDVGQGGRGGYILHLYLCLMHIMILSTVRGSGINFHIGWVV